ncbi:ribosome recycling factor [Abyssisolibacter fermentans]|uniref:ribosome recycling factor n=1 Tax=Abyssisolibacter fermentans TaxID=1766203 RepID=UPI000832A3A1|nr:ribosome recycling factor [Abyssisolibacter fermentans]
MYLEVHQEIEEKMKKTIKVLKDDISSIRAGRANTALLDRITVKYYGVDTPLKQVANISAPEPRLLVVHPYDPSIISEIEKSIQKSDLGINPSNDGKIIRLAIPQLTEERRKDLTKVLKKISESAKVALRNERRHANDILKKMNKNGDITEDDLKKAEDEVQKLTDQHIKKVDELTEKKKEELMEV